MGFGPHTCPRMDRPQRVVRPRKPGQSRVGGPWRRICARLDFPPLNRGGRHGLSPASCNYGRGGPLTYPRSCPKTIPRTQARRGLARLLRGGQAGGPAISGARLALLRLEAEEAAGSAKRKARAGLAGGVLLGLFAYLLLMGWSLAWRNSNDRACWPMAALIGAACHLVVGLPLLLMAAREPTRNPCSRNP